MFPTKLDDKKVSVMTDRQIERGTLMDLILLLAPRLGKEY